MKKGELTSTLASSLCMTKKQAGIVVDELLGIIAAEVQAGREVELRGFGVFYPSIRKPGEAVNPRTGDRMKVGEKMTGKFRAGTGMKR